MRILLFFAIAFIYACSSPDEKAIEHAKSAVASNMKDPTSLLFSSSYVIRRETNKDGFQSISICGLVNGKNGYGAYSGSTRFVVDQIENTKMNVRDSSSVHIESNDRRPAIDNGKESDSTVFEKLYWNTLCVDQYHKPTYSADKYWRIR